MTTPLVPTEAVVTTTEECMTGELTSNSPKIQPNEREGNPDAMIVQPPTSPRSMNSAHIPNPPLLPNGLSRQASPALSSVSSLTSPGATPTPQPFGFDGSAQSMENLSGSISGGQGEQPPPAKRRKLTSAEKEEQRQQKEAKARERAEQKAKRDEDKRIKDEERRKQNEIKELKRQEKELEKQRVLEEKEKKERAQQKLHSFFMKPTASTRGLADTKDDTWSEEEAGKPNLRSPAKASIPLSDYRRTFLPFSLPANARWASTNQFTWDEGSTRHMQGKIEEAFAGASVTDVNLEDSIGFCPGLSKPRGITYEPVKDIILQMGRDQSNPIDLTGSRSHNPMHSLQKIPMRYIHFQEDVRPPYCGTYSKMSQYGLFQTARNPFKRTRLDTNYDYDSEAEWEDLEDGDEDLMSEGESEHESNDGADEMDDFLDDEDIEGQGSRKKIICNDLEPICSGLRWEDERGVTSDPDGRAIPTSHMKLALLQGCLSFPLDPFSSQYWLESKTNKFAPKQTQLGAMQPPRPPLQSRPNASMNASLPSDQSAASVDAKSNKSSLPLTRRLLAGFELEQFKQAVQGSNDTKLGLVENLKKQFPKIPKAVLQDTLSVYAQRVGRNEAEKRWTLVEDSG